MAMMRVQERALIKSSWSEQIKAHTPAQLNARIARARKYWDTYRDLARQQQQRTKKTPQSGRPQPFSNLRTERKAQVFIGVLERFEQRLAQQTAQDLRKRTPSRKPVRKSSRRPGAQRETIHRKKQQRRASSDAALAPRIAR